MPYLLEYNLKPGDPGYAERPGVATQLSGRIEFAPNADHAGRRVVEVDTQEKQEELLRNGNIGVRSGEKRVIVVPTDLASSDERSKIRAVVDQRLAELGLLGPANVPAVEPDEEDHESAADGELNATTGAVELAQAMGVDLSKVEGTGPGGRITKHNVQDFLGNTN